MKRILLSCIAILTFAISFSQIPINFQVTPYQVCSNDGISVIILENKNAEVLNGLPEVNYSITYHSSEIEAFDDVNALTSPYFAQAGQMIFIRVEEVANPANFEITAFNVIDDLSSAFFPQEFSVCDNDSDGTVLIHLDEISEQIWSSAGLSPATVEISYYLTLGDANSGINQLGSPFLNTEPFNQVIYAKTNSSETGCTSVNPVYLNVMFCSSLVQPNDLVSCTDSDTACFDLSQNTTIVLQNVVATEFVVTYHLSETNAHADINPITDTSSYCVPVTLQGQNIFIRIENIASGDYEQFMFHLTGQQYIAGQMQIQPITQCDDNSDAIVTFDLVAISTLFNVVNPAQYYANSNDAIAQQNAIATPAAYSITPTNQYSSIFIREVVAGGCDILYSFQIIAYTNCNVASNCSSANPLCNVLGISFANTTNIMDAGPGDFACLGTQPNPTWFYIPISQSGQLAFMISQTSTSGVGIDVDFICYGPFTSPTAGCGALTGQNVVACSYSASAVENFTLNATAGEFYVLMVTNFANQPGEITISQTGGTGGIDCTGLQLTAFLDSNGNGQKDGSELNFPLGEFHFEMNDDGIVHNILSPFGTHFIFENDPSNTYDVSFDVSAEYAAYYAVSPASFSNISIVPGSGANMYYFPVTAVETYNDLSVSIVPTGSPSPGFTYSNKVVYTNNGNTVQSGTITFTKDADIIGLSATPSVSMTPTGFTYNYTGLQPFETREFIVMMSVPTIPTVNLGDMLTNSVQIDPIEGDQVPSNNIASVSQEIVGSFDPNDKSEAHGRQILITDFTSDDYLYYTIRFENTGTASATNVRVTDVLDSMIDAESLRMISASHDYFLERIGNQLTWQFDDIMLAAAMQNPEGAKGYVHFKVKLNPGFEEGDIVPNTAAIFFDFNPPIITNTFNTEFVDMLGADENHASEFTVYPNPASNMLNVITNGADAIKSIRLIDITGKSILSQTVSSSQTSIDVSDISTGMYFLQVESTSGKSIRKIIIE